MSALPLPDLAQCANEPIRIPGAIQPHGRMAVLASSEPEEPQVASSSAVAASRIV